MKGLFRSKFTLILIFILMAAVCVFLNLKAETIDLPNAIVSGVMFFIVFLLFVFAFIRFNRIDHMVSDFDYAAKQILADYKANDHRQLWQYYRTKENLFTEDTLYGKYAEFISEQKRMEKLSGDVYRGDIEDYINADLVDARISRNVLNLVSGTLTGLGILGTFIGLSIGLQHFNTGTADEISTSISPLIQGIKVAFYTSIYGMVFSLVYNFIYKSKADEAYEALDRFLDAFQGCVVHDSKNESFRQLLSFEKKQAEGMIELASTLGDEMAGRFDKIITPQFDRMNTTIENFAAAATQAQIEGVDRIVGRFIDSMNRSLGTSFAEIRRSIQETVEWQKEDRSYMNGILQEIGTMANDLVRLNELSGNTIQSAAGYVDHLNTLQAEINESVVQMQARLSENAEIAQHQQEYIGSLVSYEQILSASAQETAKEMSKRFDELRTLENEFTTAVRKEMQIMSQSAQKEAESVVSVSARVSEDLDRTGTKITSAAEEMSRRYAASLNETTKAFNSMQQQIESMIYATDVLRRNIASINQLKNS